MTGSNVDPALEELGFAISAMVGDIVVIEANAPTVVIDQRRFNDCELSENFVVFVKELEN